MLQNLIKIIKTCIKGLLHRIVLILLFKQVDKKFIIMFAISCFFSRYIYLDSGFFGLVVIWASSSAPSVLLPALKFSFTNKQFVLIYTILILVLLFMELPINNIYILMLPLANFWVDYFKN